jgi:hypothetical protein
LFERSSKVNWSADRRDIYDANHCDRAAEMRALAEGMKDAEPQQIMNRLADHYDKLADRAAREACPQTRGEILGPRQSAMPKSDREI